jgi:hypothetical protein
MADDDRALFESALEPVELEADAGQARDERGRFASKPEGETEPPAAQAVAEQLPEPTVTPEDQPANPASEKPKPEPRDGIPSWRLKEEADARRAAEERATRLDRELAEMRHAIQQAQRQQAPAQSPPDFWEDQAGYVRHEATALVDPIRAEMAGLREFYSRKDAIRQYGEEKVKAAYDALGEGLRVSNPESVMIYQRAMQSLDPFGDIMQWHQRQTIFSQVGSDPNAWFEKQLDERMKDPAMQAKLIERIRGNVQAQPNRPSVTQLPPSLNKATASAPPGDDDDDGEAGLLRAALRR